PPPVGGGGAGAAIVVVMLAVLLSGLASGNTLPCASFPFTVAVLVPAEMMFRVSVTVAVPPASSAPRLQGNVLPATRQVPWLLNSETNVAPVVGMESVRITCATAPGPPFTTVMVYGVSALAFTEVAPCIEIARSGGPAATEGVTAFDGADSTLFPFTFVACTVNV